MKTITCSVCGKNVSIFTAPLGEDGPVICGRCLDEADKEKARKLYSEGLTTRCAIVELIAVRPAFASGNPIALVEAPNVISRSLLSGHEGKPIS
ncbi:MAG: hypothetical protein WC378_09275 [Opitutaceae bacterium]|jgi:hypothetical protein